MLEVGYLRGYLQDKWDDEAKCPSGRPFMFLDMIENGMSCGDSYFMGDHRRIWNSCSICVNPNGDHYQQSQPSIRNLECPDVRPLEIRPIDSDDIEASMRRCGDEVAEYGHDLSQEEDSEDELVTSLANLAPLAPMDHRRQRPVVPSGISKYGFKLDDPMMENTRITFQKDPKVDGHRSYDAKRMVNIVMEVYDEICADTRATKNDLLDELERRVVLYLNQCFAFVKSDGLKSYYVEKMIDCNKDHQYPVFKSRNDKSLQQILRSAIISRNLTWPPASHSDVIFGGQTDTGKKKKPKDLFISPYKIWTECPRHLFFEKVEADPENNNPLILNTWQPNAITQEMA